MGYVPYVGFATYRRATVRIHLYFKRLMIKQMICIKKKKKIGSSHIGYAREHRSFHTFGSVKCLSIVV
jgi:hypothetical protein